MDRIKLTSITLLFFSGVFTAISLAIVYLSTHDLPSVIVVVVAVSTAFISGRLFMEVEQTARPADESLTRAMRELSTLMAEHLHGHEVQPYDPESLGQVLRGIQERLSRLEQVVHQIRADLRPVPPAPSQPEAAGPKVIVQKKT